MTTREGYWTMDLLSCSNPLNRSRTTRTCHQFMNADLQAYRQTKNTPVNEACIRWVGLAGSCTPALSWLRIKTFLMWGNGANRNTPTPRRPRTGCDGWNDLKLFLTNEFVTWTLLSTKCLVSIWLQIEFQTQLGLWHPTRLASLYVTACLRSLHVPPHFTFKITQKRLYKMLLKDQEHLSLLAVSRPER